MTYETILVNRADGIGRITLNRPEALNAINQQMVVDIEAALDDLEADADVRVIVVTGAGRAFSAGRDMKEIGGAGHRTGATLWDRLELLPKPVIAAVNGLCYTGALSMVLCFDMVIAAEGAVFADTHTKFGMYHGGGATQRLRDMVGPLLAKEIILAGRKVSGREAERIGLVNRCVPDVDLDAAVTELASMVVRNDPDAMGVAKSLINLGSRWGTAVGFDQEARAYRRQRRAVEDGTKAIVVRAEKEMNRG